MGLRLIKEQTHRFIFKIEGDKHYVDAENLSVVLSSLADLAAHIKNVGFPGSESSIRITANKEGSFQIESTIMLSLVPNLLSTIFQAGNSVTGAEHLFQSMLELLDLKKFLQGKNLDEIKLENSPDGTAIICKDGGQVKIINITLAKDFLENPNADKAISRLCNAVGNEEREGFRISDGRKEFKASNDDCKEMSNEIIAPQIAESEEEEERTVTIQLRKPDLVGKSKWSVIYLGQTIDAKMLDNDFVSKVQAGKVTLSNEAKFLARMRVKIGTDKKGKPAVISYEILQVFED